MTDASPINAEVLDKLRKLGGDKLLDKMINLFLTHCPARIETIVNSLRDEDYDTVHRTAHSLKSSAANLGANKLNALALRVEEHGASANVDDLATLVPQLQGAYDTAAEELSRVRASLRP